ncbi:hypothetical protein [Pseudomaricurvus sp.]|uniref:hypothetical protein n=1 Tax=Pseudomaricurvus sp. TaxID=2004510 RepID=UPI003F6D655B
MSTSEVLFLNGSMIRALSRPLSVDSGVEAAPESFLPRLFFSGPIFWQTPC